MKFLEEHLSKNQMADVFGLHGLVILEDKKTGKILVNKHNMILKNAKLLLLSKLLLNNNGTTFIESLTGNNITLDNKSHLKSLKSIIIGYSESDVSYTDTISIISGVSSNINLTNENIELVLNENYPDYYVLKIACSIKYNDFAGASSKNIIVNTLGTIYGEKDSINNDELFSRISFDPIIVSSDSDLNLTYYIYF